MDKLHICTVQGRALLFTLVMLFLAPLSMVTFGQSPCTSPVVRQMTDAKSTNANIYDDISIAMTNLLNDGSQTAWQLESGGTFTENVDGTARMQGVIKQFGDYASPRRMAIDIILGGKTYTPDVSGPYNQTGVPTDSWYYFTSLSGTMTGLDVLAGGQLSLSIHMHPFQAGIGANQIFNAEDQVANGGGGWFEWTVVSQPTDATLQFTNYIPGVTVSDIAILISGTPSVPCITPPNPCDGIVSIRQVTSTATNCGNGTPYAMYFGGKYYTAGPDLTFTEYTNGTAILKGTVVRNGLSFNINVTYSGKTTTAPASSPKLELCATAANTNNGAGWTYYTDMTGTVQTENCVCNVLRRGPSFQVGNFANLQQNKFGASGWFSCTNNTNTGDFNFNLGPARNCGTCDTDTEPPVFSNCPINITKDVTTMTGSCWNITWTVPTATDNCSTPVVTSNYNPGCCLPIGLTTITYTATDAKGNATVCQFTVTITRTPTCNVSGNKISKSCSNYVPVLTGTNLGNFEYMWLKSTSGCPTQMSQAIPGATGANCTLTSNVTQTTYFIRCARPVGCTTWGSVNESNCLKVNADDCNPCDNFKVTYTCGACTSTGAYTPTFKFEGRVGNVYITMDSWYGTATNNTYSLPKTMTGDATFTCKDMTTGCIKTITVSNPCPPQPTCSTNFSSTKCYRIVSKKSGKALDVYGNGTQNDCSIIQWGYHGGLNQQWRLFSLGGGYFKVMARNSSKYLACHYTTSGSSVYQYDYYTGGYKDWKVECVGNTGYYRLVHRASGKALECNSTADGGKMVINPWSGGDSQLFSIEEVSAATYSVSASSTILNMNATAESDKVRLAWLSNTGYDNDFYTVEKMNATTGDFEKMALVNNTQFDDQVQSHAVYDANPTEGDNFYRVKLTLNDGTDKLTDVKKVTFKRMVGFGAFPNPASDELYINLSEYKDKAVDIVLYNTFGKVMARQHLDKVSDSTQQINVSEYASGQYLIRVSTDGKRDATQQVVIQK